MSTPSTARNPLPNRFVSPWVSTILFSVDIMPTSFVYLDENCLSNWVVLEPGQSRAPTSAGSRRETLPSGRHRGHGTGVHGGRSAVKGGNGRGPKAFDDQINAQRKFPNRDRECDHTDRAMLRRETEDHGAVASNQQGRSDESE